MKEQIAQIVTAYWEGRLPALLNTLSHAARQVENLLTAEDSQRAANSDPARLGKALGGFGSETLDLSALSSVLQRSQGSRGMEERRRQRLQGIAEQLATLRARWAKKPPAPAAHALKKGPQALLEAFEAHMTPLAEALRLVRMAKLEARGRYDAAEHDAAFADFNWRRMESAEMALCPPFVIHTEPGRELGAQLGSLLELAASGRPLKLVVLHGSWHPEQEETGRAAALRGMGDVTLLFLALRSVYFVQTSVAAPTPMAERIVHGLESPRPAVLSIYADGAGSEDFAQRAAQALASRAFPHMVYDPERAADFVSCLNLSDNPEPEAQWVSEALVYIGADGEREELQRPLTFADYAVAEPEFAAQFTVLQESDAAHATALAAYLELEPAERWNRAPFVAALDADKHLARKVPSSAMLAHTQDRMHLWTTLQELSGIQNPFVRAAEQRLREALTAEKEQALAEQKTQLEAQFQAAQQEQVAAAMRNLAQRLTGTAVNGTAAPVAAALPATGAATGAPAASPAGSASAPAAAPATPAARTAAAPVAPSEGPWIDERLCTSCDECIAINKSLFSYNGTKKAVIKDPRAGPFKDVVRAAEKCSSGAIHPGLPLDPAEKDAEKWIKRAEAYQ